MAEILCNEEEILCDSVAYNCDGSVRIDDVDGIAEDSATYNDREY